MNRERNLHGRNGYDRDLRFDPLEFLKSASENHGQAKWLDLCCGAAKALIEAARVCDSQQLPVEIVGVDLVGSFDAFESERLEVVEASLTNWEPSETFDLITCVHGLHYIGDKLGLIARAASWLTPTGKLSANLDENNLRLENCKATKIISSLRRSGFHYSARHKLIGCEGNRTVNFQYWYLGADDQAGPNYTGQAAVNSHYALSD